MHGRIVCSWADGGRVRGPRGQRTGPQHHQGERGLIDFEDVQRMAADLLLARCPEAYRGVWPEDVVRALDHPAVVSEDGEQGPGATRTSNEPSFWPVKTRRWLKKSSVGGTASSGCAENSVPSSSMNFRTPTPHTCACWLDFGAASSNQR